MSIAQTFKSVITGQNVITPEVIRYIETRDHIIELSTGTGFNGDQLFGVTVINKHNKERVLDKDDVFYSREFAEAYIAGIK